MSLPHQDINEANRRLTRSIFGRDPEGTEPRPQYPVLGLRIVPWGMRFAFDDFRFMNQPKKFISIGAAEQCDIRLDDPTVSAEHCLIQRNRANARVYVYDAGKNGITVNGTSVKWIELCEGALLSIGSQCLMAYTERTEQTRYIIAATSIFDFVHRAVDLYGNITAAAEGIGIARSTLADWLQGKFARPRPGKAI